MVTFSRYVCILIAFRESFQLISPEQLYLGHPRKDLGSNFACYHEAAVVGSDRLSDFLKGLQPDETCLHSPLPGTGGSYLGNPRLTAQWILKRCMRASRDQHEGFEE